MKEKTLLQKAKELDFYNEVDYYQYIVDSLVNGQKKQCKELFNELNESEIKMFEVYMLESLSTVLLVTLFKLLGYSLTRIENIYFDSRNNIPKEISEIFENI